MKTIQDSTHEIKDTLGTYKKALVTESYTYFVNFEESDENGAVKMYRTDTGELFSNNYFAYIGLMEDLETSSYIYISEEMKLNFNMVIEEDYEEITDSIELIDFEDGFEYTVYVNEDNNVFFAKAGEVVHRYKLTKSLEDIRKENREDVLKYRFCPITDEMEVQLDDIFMHKKFTQLIK